MAVCGALFLGGRFITRSHMTVRSDKHVVMLLGLMKNLRTDKDFTFF